MIISASRRTDIPAFFGEWLINRLRAGSVSVRNPMNNKQVSVIPLNPDIVDCIVFWTKNSGNFYKYLDELNSMGYKYYFQFTLNSYDTQIEEGVERKGGIINSFKMLSDKIGPEKVIWRYDPVFFNSKYTIDYHSKWYEFLSNTLTGYTNQCEFSFINEYSKIKNVINSLNIESFDIEKTKQIAKIISDIAIVNNMTLTSCAVELDLSEFNIKPSKCIDNSLIDKIIGEKLNVTKDLTMGRKCGCVESRDIGTYNTCTHFCNYCYANSSKDGVIKNIQKYDVDSPLLCDKINGDEKITVYKKAISFKKSNCLQGDLF